MNDNNLWSVGSIHGDEYYTKKETAEQIVRNLVDWHLVAWLPFNDRGSVWADALIGGGYDVVVTDGDFFEHEIPNGVNCIISNPPFSIKKEILQRTVSLGLPFLYILPFTWLNDSIPLEYGHQIMLFRERMHFNTPDGSLNRPRCNCFVLSNGLLKQNMIVEWGDKYERKPHDRPNK